jgi:hypothetical protein
LRQRECCHLWRFGRGFLADAPGVANAVLELELPGLHNGEKLFSVTVTEAWPSSRWCRRSERNWEGSGRRQNLRLGRLSIVPEEGPGTRADELAVVRSPDPLRAVTATHEFVAVVFAVLGVTGVDGQHRSSHFSGIFRPLGDSVETRMSTVQNAVQKSL